MNKQSRLAPAADLGFSPVPGSAANPLGEALATPIGATLALTKGSDFTPTGEAGAPNLSPYQLRYDPCTACDTAVTFSCDECCGTGEVLAGCADCSKCLPLHDGGLCARCEDARELPLAAFNAKYLGQGWARVEL